MRSESRNRNHLLTSDQRRHHADWRHPWQAGPFLEISLNSRARAINLDSAVCRLEAVGACAGVWSQPYRARTAPTGFTTPGMLQDTGSPAAGLHRLRPNRPPTARCAESNLIHRHSSNDQQQCTPHMQHGLSRGASAQRAHPPALLPHTALASSCKSCCKAVRIAVHAENVQVMGPRRPSRHAACR